MQNAFTFHIENSRVLISSGVESKSEHADMNWLLPVRVSYMRNVWRKALVVTWFPAYGSSF